MNRLAMFSPRTVWIGPLALLLLVPHPTEAQLLIWGGPSPTYATYGVKTVMGAIPGVPIRENPQDNVLGTSDSASGLFASADAAPSFALRAHASTTVAGSSYSAQAYAYDVRTVTSTTLPVGTPVPVLLSGSLSGSLSRFGEYSDAGGVFEIICFRNLAVPCTPDPENSNIDVGLKIGDAVRPASSKSVAQSGVRLVTVAVGESFIVQGHLRAYAFTDLFDPTSATADFSSTAIVDVTPGPGFEDLVVIASLAQQAAGGGGSALTFLGFEPPISDQVLNIGRRGRTYPVKFQVQDASGQVVGDLSAVHSITVLPVSCATFQADATQEISATATGGTSLRYDPATTQFVFNWQMPGTAGCYKLRVTLADGGVYTASFRLN